MGEMLAEQDQQLGQRGGTCLSELEIVQFASGTLGAENQERAEDHLANCAYCRGQLAFAVRAENLDPPDPEVASSARQLAEHESRFWGGWLRPVVNGQGLSVAAAVLALVLGVSVWSIQRRGTDQESPLPSVRNVPAQDLSPELVLPAEGSRINLTDLQLEWRAVPDTIFYKISVVTAAGDLVWESKTEASEIKPPLDAGLESSQTYFVWVEAQLSDGSAIRSRLVSFQIAENRETGA